VILYTSHNEEDNKTSVRIGTQGGDTCVHKTGMDAPTGRTADEYEVRFLTVYK
jgi:hypothetical protein